MKSKRTSTGTPGRTSRRSASSEQRRSSTAASKETSALNGIVGVGASAGGLQAFKELLQHLPADTGLAFVLVQHLDPISESILVDLLTPSTTMPVRQVTNNFPVAPNHVYVIPPNTVMSIQRGILKLAPRQKLVASNRAIDSFFESLALDQGNRVVGIVLSGTATDGTLGLEAIKAEGGITMAQDESAKYDSMPRSAVGAGCVDRVLPPQAMGKELAEIARHFGRDRSLLALEGGKRTRKPGQRKETRDSGVEGAETEVHSSDNDADFKRILLLLRRQSGVEFDLYKTSTLNRRIGRRMVLNKISSLKRYAELLDSNPKELEALYADVLIGVTSFFRNAETFEVLKRKILPRVLSHGSGEDFRVWVLGCSMGQEAYSLAMAFAEATDEIPRPPRLQVFATDLNEGMLEKARAGLYGKTLTRDLSPERLARFFVEENGGHRVNKHLREQCVFARQNLISDPPFSRMNLISCRNLMIYLETDVQKRAIPTFHYALKPGGVLLLGGSETIGAYTNLFQGLDKKHRIYLRKPGSTPHFRLPLLSGRSPVNPADRRSNRASSGRDLARSESQAQREADRLTAKQFAPPSVLIDAQLQIIEFRGRTGPYLEAPAGKATREILRMVRDEILMPLQSAIQQAKKTGKTVRKTDIQIDPDDRTRTLAIEVIPLTKLDEKCFLILFDEIRRARRSREAGRPPENISESPAHNGKGHPRRIRQLEQELAETRDYLQSIREQHEAAREELQSSTDDLQSANEELQSVNEELETSKEELESGNEELATVNEEMVSRNDELVRLNTELNNLHASIKTPILVLGKDLAIRRFTQPAERLFNLLATDVGRSFTGIGHNLNLPDLAGLTLSVINTGREREQEVQDLHGRWFLLRARPYLSLERSIDGAVLMLTDIDALKRSEAIVRFALDYDRAILRTARDPLLVLNQQMVVDRASEAFCRLVRERCEQLVGRSFFELSGGAWNIPQLRVLLEDILPRNAFFDDFEAVVDLPMGRRTLLLNARGLESPHGHMKMVLLSMQDITERLHFQTALRSSELRFRRLFEAAQDGILVLDGTSARVTDANVYLSHLTGRTKADFLGKELKDLGLFKSGEDCHEMLQTVMQKRMVRMDTEIRHADSGETLQLEVVANLYDEGERQTIQCNIRDITERKCREKEISQAKDRLHHQAEDLEDEVKKRTAALQATTSQLETFVYSVAHDLRAPLRSMQGFAELLVGDYGSTLEGQAIEYANRINRSAQFMDRLLQDLLAFAGVSEQEVALEPVELPSALQAAVAELRADIEDCKGVVDVDDRRIGVLAQPAMLQRVLVNLLCNAIKFVAPGVEPRIRLRAEERLETVRLWVEDNGIGIPPEHQKQIFGVFKRLHGVEYPGTGIGLAIVSKGVERMGGLCGVESGVNEGSRFWIELMKCEAPSA